jgi:polyisoprenoid-binding protein YceI
LLAAVSLAASSPPQTDLLELNPAQTRIDYTLAGSMEGHTTHGTFRLKTGIIKADPATGDASGEVIVDARSGDSGEKLRDSIMNEKVLESAKYPEIVFTPRHIAGRRDPRTGAFDGIISGVILLHGAQHPMAIKVDGKLIGNQLTANCHFVIPYAAWGMANPSFLMFRVADNVSVSIATAGRVTWSAAPGAQNATGSPIQRR